MADPAPSPAPPPRLRALARRLRALPPSCGPVRLVAVDGYAGSGKTTFAGLLAEALGGAPVVHLDDLATHEELFEWTGRLREQVLDPLSGGRAARYRVYDWEARRFDGERELPPAPVVLLEGVSSGRRAVRPYLALLLWLEVDRQLSWERGRLRDGPGQSLFWDGWMRAERRHFTEDPSRPHAHVLVRQGEEGLMWSQGPAVTA